jgi:hypothetical protein
MLPWAKPSRDTTKLLPKSERQANLTDAATPPLESWRPFNVAQADGL